MFWGLVLEPNKRYTEVVEKAFHITHAALDISTGDTKPCQVMVATARHNGKSILLCTLQKNKVIQYSLHLYFKQGDTVSFLTSGKSNIHLSGYLAPEYEDKSSGEKEEEDDDEEQLINAAKRKLEREDANNAKKPKQEKKAKKPVAQDSDDSDSDENVESFDLTEGEVVIVSDEESVEEGNEEEAKAEEDDEEAEADSSEAATTMDTSKEQDVDMSKLSESERKLLKKKLAQQNGQPQERRIVCPPAMADAESVEEGNEEEAEGEEDDEEAESDSLEQDVDISQLTESERKLLQKKLAQQNGQPQERRIFYPPPAMADEANRPPPVMPPNAKLVHRLMIARQLFFVVKLKKGDVGYPSMP